MQNLQYIEAEQRLSSWSLRHFTLSDLTDAAPSCEMGIMQSEDAKQWKSIDYGVPHWFVMGVPYLLSTSLYKLYRLS